MQRRIFTATLLAVLASPHLLPAQGTRLWLQSRYDDFEKGRPEGVGVSSRGYLEAGPELQPVLLTPSTYIWAMTADSRGDAFLATGSPATVLKIAPDGNSTKLFSSKNLSVQAIVLGSDQSVYAATLPGGKVYRIAPGQSGLDESTAAVVFDPAKLPEKIDGEKANPGTPAERPKYIWDLAFDAQGKLYVATGGPAAIYRVDVSSAKGEPELFFSSDEQHIRCLLFEPDGSLIAGTDGSGLVYRIGKDGRGIVIFDAPKREVTALAQAPDGRLYLAAVGEKAKSSLPPLPVQGNAIATATITIVTPGSVQASNANALIPEGSEIDELSPEGAPRKLWASSGDVVYALRSTPQGLLAATGNRGKIYRISEDGSYLDLARAASGQATAFANAPGGIYVATSNTGRLYKLGDHPAAHGSYVSDVFDSGIFSRWGRAEVNTVDGGPSGPYELYVRSGNVENPERNWSPWQKIVPNGTSLSVPPARFIQWKAVLEPGSRIASVGIDYLPANVAPVVDEIAVEPGARATPSVPQQPQSVTINLPSLQAGITYTQDAATAPLVALKDRTAVTVRWAAHDDNGDDLVFDVYFRGDGEKNWRLLKSHLNDRFYSFDAITLPDGGYRLKIVASDSPSHPAGDALTGENVSDHFVIDTTPPVLSAMKASLSGGKVHATLQAEDATSPIAHAEYSLDAGPWQYLEPVGKISDSQVERYDFTIPLQPPSDHSGAAQIPVSDPNEHVLAVRVYDRYDNVVAAKTVVD